MVQRVMEERELTEKKDAQDIAEILSVVRTQVPGLIKDLIDAVYSPDTAATMAKSIATFYKTLIENGIDQKEALEMSKGLVIDFRKIFQGLGRKNE